MKSFQNFLTEKESAKSCREKFQKVLFGEFQGLEKDTKIEAEMYQQILRWLSTMNPSGDNDAKAAMKAFETLKDCRPYFKKELIPTAKKAYRGKIIPVKDILRGTPKNSGPITMNMIGQIRANNYLSTRYRIAMVESKRVDAKEVNSAQKFMELMTQQQEDLPDGEVFVSVPYTFKPSKMVSSFTDTFAHAMQFAFSDDMSYSGNRFNLDHVAVIIEVPVDKEFVMNAKFMNMLGREAGHKYAENEMIRVSKKPVKGKVHFMFGELMIQELRKKR